MKIREKPCVYLLAMEMWNSSTRRPSARMPTLSPHLASAWVPRTPRSTWIGSAAGEAWMHLLFYFVTSRVLCSLSCLSMPSVSASFPHILSSFPSIANAWGCHPWRPICARRRFQPAVPGIVFRSSLGSFLHFRSHNIFLSSDVNSVCHPHPDALYRRIRNTMI